MDRSASTDPRASLDRIEAAVEEGNTDLRALGFWPIVARVKADPSLVDGSADQIGRIDTAAFRAAVGLRAPVWLGNLVLLIGVAVGAAFIWLAFAWDDAAWKGLSLVAAAAVWAVAVHSPTHWAVGRAVGIRFTDYFLGGPPPPRPGLKTDYATYLRTDPGRRAWMHASGAIATKLAPLVALAFWPASGAPGWSALVLVALAAFQIVTDVTLSRKSSDWKRFARERAIARARS